jgi:hypothetical protein
MENYLYFASAAADGTGSTEEVIMVPASGVSHYEMVSTTELDVWFKSTYAGGVAQETNIGDDDLHVDHAKVRLTITSGKHKEVMQAIAGGASDSAGNGGFTVIADVENSAFINAYITGVAITIIDATA